MRLRHLLLLSLCSLSLTITACMLEPVDFAGKSCADAACPEGFSCEPSTLLCVAGALPADAGTGPVADAGLPPACNCTDGRVCCDGQCIDTTTDPLHCGACGNSCPSFEGAQCRDSTCTVESDVARSALWSSPAPGPYLALWEDGTLLAADESNASNLKFDGTRVVKKDAPTGWSSRPTVFIPPSAGAKEVAIGYLGAFVAVNQDLDEVWTNRLVDCCGRQFDGFPLDPAKGQIYVSEFTVLDAVDGKNTQNKAGVMSVHVLEATLIGPATNDNTVHKRSRADFSESFSPVVVGQPNPTGGPNFNRNGAVTSDDGIVVTSTERNLLARITSGGTKWEKTVESPTDPVLTADGIIVVGAGKPTQDRLEAHRVSDGSKVWEIPTEDRVRDLLVADNGLIYVAQAKSVLGVRQSDGRTVETYRNTGPVAEMLLRDGVIYAFADGKVTAFKVTAKGYEKGSPWPVRYHDNQRTRSRTASLDH